MRITALANGQYMEGWAWSGYLKEYKEEEDYQLQFRKMVNKAQSKMSNAKITLDNKRIQFLIKNGADINTESTETYKGWTLLDIVVSFGDIEDFRFLLANGANFQESIAARLVVQRTDIGFESKKAFLSVLQDYGYDFKADRRGLLEGAIYSSFKCRVTVKEVEEQGSELLDFLKKKLDIERVSEILNDEDIETLCGA